MKIDFICPCCGKNAQITLFYNGDTGDVKITSVFSIDESELNKISDDKIFSEYGICLAESEVKHG